MSSRFNAFYVVCGLYVLLDVYTYLGLRSLFVRKESLIAFQILYLLSSLFVYFSFYQFYTAFTSGGFFSKSSANFYMGIVLTAIITKLAFVFLIFAQDLARFLYGIGAFIYRLFAGEGELPGDDSFLPDRRRFVTLVSAGIASIPLFTMLYGITKGKYAYTVNKVKLAFKDLPPAFEGFKVVQISDIHAGSLDSIEEVAKGVRMINEEAPDLILFTGDLVNSDKDEVDPFIDVFKELSATHGKYCTLGNHDYYGIRHGANSREIEEYWKDFHAKYEAMGFRLLNNEHDFIQSGKDRICVVGVENWGKGRWFPKRGDLSKALENTAPEDFCILLSHDPTHWDEKVLPHPKHIHLTLSGHTHGFQFGINMPGFRWSPAQYRYPRWMGLYEQAQQYLYVNRGFGFLAFPGRVGMWPEITVIELTRTV